MIYNKEVCAVSDVERFVQLFTERWREPNPDRFGDLFHSEGGFQHPGRPRVPREEIPAYWRLLSTEFPGLSLTPTAWAEKDGRVFIEWTASATPGGKLIEWQGVTRFTLRGDRALEGRSYFDTLPLRRAATA
jgi:hypothetical protein